MIWNLNFELIHIKKGEPNETREAGRYERETKEGGIMMAEDNERKKQFDARQLLEIKMGIRKKLDTQIYNDVNLKAEEMREIRLGLESNLDVSKYADKGFQAEQMAQIRVGMEHGIDVDQYLNPDLNAAQMLQIRTGMEQGLDAKEYASQNYDAEQMKQIRIGMKLGLDTKQFNHPAMTAEQMKDLRLAMTTQKVMNKIKEQLKGILDSFLKATNLYIHFPSKEAQNTMSPKITEVLNERAQEVIKERLQEAETQKEPESMKEVEQQVRKDLEKPEIQDKILDNQTIEKLQDLVEETKEQTVEESSKGVEQHSVEKTLKEPEEINYHEDPRLNQAIKNYIQYREEIGFPMLKSQIQPTIDHVAFMDRDLSHQAEIFNQTVTNGWKALYPLKNQNQEKGQGRNQSYGKNKIEANKFNNFEQRDYDFDKLETALQQRTYQPDGLNQVPQEEPGIEI